MFNIFEKIKRKKYNTIVKGREKCLGQEKTDLVKDDVKSVPKKESNNVRTENIKNINNKILKINLREFYKNSLFSLKIMELHLIVYRNYFEDIKIYRDILNFFKQNEKLKNNINLIRSSRFIENFQNKLNHFKQEALEIRKKIVEIEQVFEKIEKRVFVQNLEIHKEVEEKINTIKDLLDIFEIDIILIQKYLNKFQNDLNRKKVNWEIFELIFKKLEND